MGLRRKMERNKMKSEKTQFIQSLKGAPVMSMLETIMNRLRTLYAENEWVFKDPVVVSTMEEGRKKYEESEKKIKDCTRINKREAIEEATVAISKRFDRLEEKKLLQLQLKAMKLEESQLTHFIDLKNKNDKEKSR